jgi:hypothetical protein
MGNSFEYWGIHLDPITEGVPPQLQKIQNRTIKGTPVNPIFLWKLAPFMQ